MARSRGSSAVWTRVVLAVGALAACGGGVDVQPLPTYLHAGPSAVAVSPPFVELGLGNEHGCGLAADGGARCWGRDDQGQLGTSVPLARCDAGNTPCSATPLAVEGGPAFVAVDGSVRHTCALAADGGAWCWGFGAGGQLGDGRRSDSASPVQVATSARFTKIDVGIGGLLSCGLVVDGSIACWGPGNQGGIGDGSAWCWGRNGYGKLGLGGPGAALLPQAVATTQRFSAIAAGNSHTCALATDGSAWCWGAAAMLGNGGAADSALPVPVSGALRFASLQAGMQHSCALTAAGSAYCWGGTFAPLGDGVGNVARSVPTAVAGGLVFRRLAAGGVVGCGITTGGTTYCWGDNTNGAVAQPDTAP